MAISKIYSTEKNCHRNCGGMWSLCYDHTETFGKVWVDKKMREFWEKLDRNTAGDAILTGYVGRFKDMPVYDSVINLAKAEIDNDNLVLDFGCGVGRNSVALAKSYKKVISFDLPNMIDLVPEENKLSNIVYTSDWELVKDNSYNTVLASLVFQHINDDELHSYLSDIKTNKLVLHSRTWIDDTQSKVLTIVEKYFKVTSIEYQKDPNGNSGDHFLAVLTK